MDPWISLLLFLSNIADDMLAVLYVRRTAAGKAFQAALFSGALTLIVAFSVIHYVEDKLYLIPIILGSALGAYVGVKWDKAYKKRKRGRRKKEKDEDRKAEIKNEQRGNPDLQERSSEGPVREGGSGG